jgi:hypothetical protein
MVCLLAHIGCNEAYILGRHIFDPAGVSGADNNSIACGHESFCEGAANAFTAPRDDDGLPHRVQIVMAE